MPCADNHGVRSHYQIEGEEPPLVLQHGLTSSLKRWYMHGYVEAPRVSGVTVVSHSAAVGGALQSRHSLLRRPTHALTWRGTGDPEQLESG
jgi:hypothetical protein